MDPSIAERITQFVKQTFLIDGGDAPLGIDTPLIESGIIDSLGVVEIVAFVEEEFIIEVSDEEIAPENMNSIGRLAHLVMKKRGDSDRTPIGAPIGQFVERRRPTPVGVQYHGIERRRAQHSFP